MVGEFCYGFKKTTFICIFIIILIPRSYEGILDGDMSGAGDYYWGGGAPLASGERGSMASLDSTLNKPKAWRQPELPEVIAMLNYRLDPVKSNAAAYLQHLTFKNDKVGTTRRCSTRRRRRRREGAIYNIRKFPRFVTKKPLLILQKRQSGSSEGSSSNTNTRRRINALYNIGKSQNVLRKSFVYTSRITKWIKKRW